jgi:hypothetical protein
MEAIVLKVLLEELFGIVVKWVFGACTKVQFCVKCTLFKWYCLIWPWIFARQLVFLKIYTIIPI